MKKCGLITRVSTDRQSSNPEGSLKNQSQALRAHLEYKNKTSGDEWIEYRTYRLEAISGKDSYRSKEFARLIEDIKARKINVVLCTALDRVSRSVKDFINFIELLNNYGVEFVCLKQNFDTSSPQGKFFFTVMIALAEFEREQTSARTKDATMARAERGLWNGGQLFGYDLNPNRKGYLIPNEEEKIIVNLIFDIYLECGSIIETAKILNKRGYRTKEYHSRRDNFHPADKYCYTAVQTILTNHAYIGEKEINKKKKAMDQNKLPENERYRVVKAVWEPIVEENIFHRVQALLEKNHRTRHNQAKPIKHNYLLNRGLLWCEKCGEEMEGRSGTGAKGIRYYYYRCKNKECGFKVPANEIEGIVLGRIKNISNNKNTLVDIVKFTNKKLQKELPQLKEQGRYLHNELERIKKLADRIINQWASITGDEDNPFIKEKLNKLVSRKKEIETRIQAQEEMIGEIEQESVSQELVMTALNQMTEVFEHIQPHEQKELLRLILHKAVISPEAIKIALYGRPPQTGLLSLSETGQRAQISDWLPG